MLRGKSVMILLLVHITLSCGQNTCDTCASDTEYTPCGTSDVLPCSNFGENYICVPDAPRDSLCLSPPPPCTRQGKFLFPEAQNDCDRYYECDTFLVATTKFCTDEKVFSELNQDCVTVEESECLMISSTSTSDVTSNEPPNTTTQLSSESTVSSSTVDTDFARSETSNASTDPPESTSTSDVTSNEPTNSTTQLSSESTVSSSTVDADFAKSETSNASSDPPESTSDIPISSTVTSDTTTEQSEPTTVVLNNVKSKIEDEVSSSPTSIITTTDGEITTDISPTTGDISSANPTETTLTTNIMTSTEGSTPGNRDVSEQETTSESNENTTDDLTTTDIPTTSEPPTSDITSTQISTTETSQKCSRFSKFPDLTDCHKFYVCIWRPFFGYTKVSRKCPFSLVYDETKNSCRFDADCGDRPRST